MMGVPKEDRPHVRHLAEKLLNIGRGEADRMGPLVEGMQGMIDYVSPLVDERLVKPGDDFISVLARWRKRGIFTRHQVLVNTSLLLLAGHETTINLLCNGTLSFIHHQEQWELLKENPAARAKQATEECLRYDAPVKSIQRIASQDVEMRGKILHKDDRIRWFITSANRDPEVFAQADTFDISRDPEPACGLWIWRASLSRGHHSTAGRPGGLQGAGGALPLAAFGDRTLRVSAQHHVSLVKISTRDLELGRSVMARKLRVWVDHNVCVGNAMCETFAPQVFQLNANRQSEAVNPAGDPEEKILEAAENCPVSAIFVEDADTGERLFP